VSGPELPIAPDGNSINLFGQPYLTKVEFSDYPTYLPGIVGWMWEYPSDMETERRGYWGGMGNVSLTFRVTGGVRQNLWQKQIWIAMIFLARKDGGDTYDISVATDANFTDTNESQPMFINLEELDEPEGNVGRWYRLTAVYTVSGKAKEQYIRLTAYHLPIASNPPMGGAAVIDHVDIDMRVVTADFAGKIDFRDYAALARQYKKESPNFDLCPDGLVDLKDLDIFLDSWLKQGTTE
jgi:hypothetical protein